MNRSKVFNILNVLGIFLLFACSNESTDPERGQYAPGLSGDDGGTIVVQPLNSTTTNTAPTAATIYCGVGVSHDVVRPDEAVSITVAASGGTAPYKLDTAIDYGTFSLSQTVTGYFVNDGTVNRIVEKNFAVVDSQGNQGSCNFKITVLPKGGLTSLDGMGCQLSANPATPSAGQVFQLTLQPKFSGSYNLQSLQLQNDWSITPNSVASTAIIFPIKYTTSGSRTITATLVSGKDRQVYSCSLAVIVSP